MAMEDIPPNSFPPENTGPVVGSSGYLRLFLDDDPARAEAFFDKFPDAHWVQTSVDCISSLAEKSWDEIHLDHDLEGEWFVDSERADCGMEVVRWLTAEPRTHLMAAKFVVHSHNQNAAMVMVTQLGLAGYYVLEQPFGTAPKDQAGPAMDLMQPLGNQAKPGRGQSKEPLKDEPEKGPGLIKRILRWFVPPPSVDKPWQNAPGLSEMGAERSGKRSGRGAFNQGVEIFDPNGLDGALGVDEDTPGPYVMPIREDDTEPFRTGSRRRARRNSDDETIDP